MYTSESTSIHENFSVFFNQFKEDSSFQLQRIDKPLVIVISDEESETETTQNINYVSFKQRDWRIKIDYRAITVSKDTVNVILEGLDTGLRIEHIFARMQGKWYLLKIKDLST